MTSSGTAPAWAGFFGSTTGGVIASGALAGAASGAILTGTVEGTLKGALWGGITAGVSFGVAEGVSALTDINAHSATLFSQTAAKRTAGFIKAIAHRLSQNSHIRA